MYDYATDSLLPISPVAVHIVVDEVGLVPLSTNPPINLQMLGKVRRHILPCSVRRPTSEEELMLRCIDQASTRAACDEAFHRLTGVLVIHASFVLLARRLRVRAADELVPDALVMSVPAQVEKPGAKLLRA